MYMSISVLVYLQFSIMIRKDNFLVGFYDIKTNFTPHVIKICLAVMEMFSLVCILLFHSTYSSRL